MSGFPEGVISEITPRMIRWEMDWSKLTKDGTRAHPDKPDKEPMFEREQALALLLLNEVVFFNTYWYQKDWPEEAKKGIKLLVICNDVFAWGCADCEDIELDKLEELYSWWEKDDAWGAAVWCMIQRGSMPQGPVAKRIRERGKIDLDAVQREYGLKANHYDNVSRVISDHDHEAYSAWMRSRGLEPFDRMNGKEYWESRKAFNADKPGWQDEAHKAERERRIAAWKIEAGWATEEAPS